MKTKLTVRNCNDKGFDFVCPRDWSALNSTDIESQRFCSHCNETVYLCTTDAETLSHARAGHCVARELPDESELPVIYLGRPTNPPPITESHERALEWTYRERGIDDSLKNFDSERCCPKCEFPAPDWRVDCRVCGFKMGRVNRGSAP